MPLDDGAVAPAAVVGVGAVVATELLELVVDDVVVVTAALADAPVGTVSWGAPVVSDLTALEPQAARARASTSPIASAARAVAERVIVKRGGVRNRVVPSAGRRPGSR